MMKKVTFLFSDTSYGVAQTCSNKTLIVFANRIDINSDSGSIFLTHLNIKDSDDGVIRGNLNPFTTNRNIARRLSEHLNDYLNVEINKRRWYPEGYNPNTSWDAKFAAKEIESDQSSGYGVVWENIPTPDWSTDNIWDGTPKTSTVVTRKLNEFFDFFHEEPNVFTINEYTIHSKCQVLQFRSR
jgi:hypothetical protein